MPVPVALALGVIQMGSQLYSSYKQKKQADDTVLQNTTTPAEAEALAMSRQGANSARMPGMSAAENRLGMVQAGAMQNARLGAASSADFLASAGAADARRAQGEQTLQTQGLQYQDRMKGQLRQDLATASKRSQHDLDVYNAQKGALTQASATNLNNALGGAAAYAAEAQNEGFFGGTPNRPPGSMGVAGSAGGDGQSAVGPSYNDPNGGFAPGFGGGGFGRRSARYNPNYMSTGY